MTQRAAFKRKGKRGHWLFRGWGILVLFFFLLLLLYLLFLYCFRYRFGSPKTEKSVVSSLVLENGNGDGGVSNGETHVATTKATSTPPTVQEKIAKLLLAFQMQEQKHEAQVAVQEHEEYVHHNTVEAKHTPLLPHLAAKKAERLEMKAAYLAKLFAAQAEYDEKKAGIFKEPETTSMPLREAPLIAPMSTAAVGVGALAPPPPPLPLWTPTATTTTTTPGIKIEASKNEVEMSRLSQGVAFEARARRGRRRSRGGGDGPKVVVQQERFHRYARANKSQDTLLEADFYVNETGIPLSILALGIPVMRKNRTNGEGMSWQQFLQKPIFEQKIEQLEEQDAFAHDGAGSISNVTSRRKKRMLLVKDANENLQSNIIRVTKGHICRPEVSRNKQQDTLIKVD